jgi:hypothetical protein
MPQTPVANIYRVVKNLQTYLVGATVTVGANLVEPIISAEYTAYPMEDLSADQILDAANREQLGELMITNKDTQAV